MPVWWSVRHEPRVGECFARPAGAVLVRTRVGESFAPAPADGRTSYPPPRTPDGHATLAVPHDRACPALPRGPGERLVIDDYVVDRGRCTVV